MRSIVRKAATAVLTLIENVSNSFPILETRENMLLVDA